MTKPATGNVTALDVNRTREELVRKVEKEILDGDTYSPSLLIDRMKRDMLDIGDTFFDIGRCALAMKELMDHGEFKKTVMEHFERPGMMSFRHLENAMRLAKFGLAHGGKINFLADLPRMKQLMLAAASDEDVDDEAGTIFGLDESELRYIKIKDLREMVDKLQGKIEKQKADLERGKTQLLEAREKAERYGNAYKFVHGEAEADTLRKIKELKDQSQAIFLQLAEWDPTRGNPAENAAVFAALIEIGTMLDQYTAEVQAKYRQAGVAV